MDEKFKPGDRVVVPRDMNHNFTWLGADQYRGETGTVTAYEHRIPNVVKVKWDNPSRMGDQTFWETDLVSDDPPITAEEEAAVMDSIRDSATRTRGADA